MIDTLLIILTVVSNSFGQYVADISECPGLIPVESFDVSAFMGTWFLHKTYMDDDEMISRCHTFEFRKINNTAIEMKLELDKEGDIRVHQYILHIAESGEGILYTNERDTLLGQLPNGLYILGTDYDGYAVLWSCEEVFETFIENAYILSRLRDVPDDIQKAYAILNIHGLATSPLNGIEQDNCMAVDVKRALLGMRFLRQ